MLKLRRAPFDPLPSDFQHRSAFAKRGRVSSSPRQHVALVVACLGGPLAGAPAPSEALG